METPNRKMRLDFESDYIQFMINYDYEQDSLFN